MSWRDRIAAFSVGVIALTVTQLYSREQLTLARQDISRQLMKWNRTNDTITALPTNETNQQIEISTDDIPIDVIDTQQIMSVLQFSPYQSIKTNLLHSFDLL